MCVRKGRVSICDVACDQRNWKTEAFTVVWRLLYENALRGSVTAASNGVEVFRVERTCLRVSWVPTTV